MDATTLLIAIVVIGLAAAAAAVVVVRRRSARRASRPLSSSSEARTFVGIDARRPASDATMVGPMVQRPASARSDATIVDVHAAPPAAPAAAASDAPTVVVGARPADATAPTIRVPKPRARITVMKGGSGTHELDAREHTIGRSAHADIVLADPSVSGHHAKLAPRGDAFALSDLGSTNGTTVDGRAVQGEHPLRGGETIGVGDARLRYERLV